MAINLAVKTQKPTSSIVLLIPIAYLIILFTISYFVIKTGYSKIKSQRALIANAKKMEAVLLEKESSLKAISSEISQYVSPVSIALPDKNPALFLISQIKGLSDQSSTSMTDFKIGGGSAGTEPKIRLSYKLTGPYSNIISFFKASETIAPIVSLQKLEMSILNDIANVDVSMDSYWSEYPEKIPSLTDPISKLSSSNYEALDKVIGLTPPFFTSLSPTGPTLRQNPFF